jgi:hypothetical protein
MEDWRIQAGDALEISPYDQNMIEAMVTGMKPLVLRLQDKANVGLHEMLTEFVEGNLYRIDKLANWMGFHRQFSAVLHMENS